jgi:hypothetical protein
LVQELKVAFAEIFVNRAWQSPYKPGVETGGKREGPTSDGNGITAVRQCSEAIQEIATQLREKASQCREWRSRLKGGKWKS